MRKALASHSCVIPIARRSSLRAISLIIFKDAKRISEFAAQTTGVIYQNHIERVRWSGGRFEKALQPETITRRPADSLVGINMRVEYFPTVSCGELATLANLSVDGKGVL